MDGALSNLDSWKVLFPWQRGWNRKIFNNPSNPNHSLNVTLEMLKFTHTSDVQNIVLKPTETILI